MHFFTYTQILLLNTFGNVLLSSLPDSKVSTLRGFDGGHLFELGRCEGLTDCHQCEAGLLIALVYNFSHGHTATLGG